LNETDNIRGIKHVLVALPIPMPSTHQKNHVDSPGIEPGPLPLEVCD